MPEIEEKPSNTNQPVDLTALQSLSFGPAWSSTSDNLLKKHSKDVKEDSRKTKRSENTEGSATSHKDRRSVGSPQASNKSDTRPATHDRDKKKSDRPATRDRDNRDRGNERNNDRGRRNEPRQQEDIFEPVVQVLFYPEDGPFEKLAKAIKASCRTFELFELARLILEKNERFILVIKPFAKSHKGTINSFYCTVPENYPFTTEEEAVNYVFTHRFADFCTKEEIEIEGPKGNFPFVTKCPTTGIFIGPPNYHRYQSLLREHHAKHAPRMPLERFIEKLEKCSDAESIASWSQSMTKQTRYKVTVEGAEPLYFETVDALKHHFLSTQREKIVKHYETVRLQGSKIADLPKGLIQKSIDYFKQQQIRFPLDTANNLRGRLRRMKFNIYKRGSKGASFVSGVKRRFRDEHTLFADSITALVDFLEAHPDTFIKDLPEQYLGITLPKATAEVTPNTVTTPSVSTSVSATETATSEDAPITTESSNEATPVPIPVAPTPTAKPTQPLLSEDDNKRIKQLMQDIRWLVSEGFVTEFGDGRLFVQPVIPSSQHSTIHKESEVFIPDNEADIPEAVEVTVSKKKIHHPKKISAPADIPSGDTPSAETSTVTEEITEEISAEFAEEIKPVQTDAEVVPPTE